MSTELSVIVAVVPLLVMALVWLFSKFENIKEKNHKLELQIKDLEKRIEVQENVTSEIKAYTNMFIKLLQNQLEKKQ
ncbi:hypothetical protein [Capnocytophaga catalasegens]|uniref:Phage protein n=1 Tax=Capnocytophaga catalasegens TaxID=1004260 RepID=A0AAV5AYS8_9FLAO|nr:hypothetical protein [Capnocytophaga catalasegens]GIZ16639.1 hypothetical protein RCZ03_26390 [Capnocytophaga catalasegens]GJM51660.1 hypothetical protein RCZ15_26330 [Capnocytophaga catalasegens]GJM54009.1 hypothetical protein RCZ16_23250 [Capnocytophaga catalasegens]